MWLANTYFLGLNLGFWLIGLPIASLLIYMEYIEKHNEKLKKEDLISRLPNSKLQFDINKDERWMLDSLRKMSPYNTDEKFLRHEIKKILENEHNKYSKEFDI